MSRSVALLRGINVGPTTKVPMAVLLSAYPALKAMRTNELRKEAKAAE